MDIVIAALLVALTVSAIVLAFGTLLAVWRSILPLARKARRARTRPLRSTSVTPRD